MTSQYLSASGQSVRLRQPMIWSRAIALGMIGLIGFTTLWATVSTTEEVVSASGKLEPEGAVKEIQPPMNSVVKEVLVHDGQQVKKGEVLIRFETRVEQAKLNSLQRVRAALAQENEVYQLQLTGKSGAVAGTNALNRTQQTLLAENQVYRAQLGSDAKNSLSPEQQMRLQSRRSELRSRLNTAQLQAGQIQQQLRQVEIQIEATKTQLASAQANLNIEQGVLKDLEPVVLEGAIPKIRLSEQRQKVIQNQSEVAKVLQEQHRLQSERQRLYLDVEKAQEQVQTITASNQEEVLAKISNNEKNLAEINENTKRAILESQRKIAEIDGQLTQAKQAVQFQELRSPVDGTVFELKPMSAGFVANPGITLVKIVPQDSLVAKIFISNKDIGFVKPGMEVSVKLDSFPSQEFGDVKGELVWIGSDALSPEQARPYYHFPAKVRLKKSSLRIGEQEITLRSGMSFNSTIKIRDRSILSIFTGALFQQTEELKLLR